MLHHTVCPSHAAGEEEHCDQHNVEESSDCCYVRVFCTYFSCHYFHNSGFSQGHDALCVLVPLRRSERLWIDNNFSISYMGKNLSKVKLKCTCRSRWAKFPLMAKGSRLRLLLVLHIKVIWEWWVVRKLEGHAGRITVYINLQSSFQTCWRRWQGNGPPGLPHWNEWPFDPELNQWAKPSKQTSNKLQQFIKHHLQFHTHSWWDTTFFEQLRDQHIS